MFYSIGQYLKYKWNAKGRHGTHSPFVYALVEDVLHRSRSGDELIDDMAAYYQVKKVTYSEQEFANVPPCAENSTTGQPLTFCRMLVLDISPDAEALINKVLTLIQHDDILVLRNISYSKKNRQLWEALAANPKVKLSADLFHTGLLFFRKEFKEKQHFVLTTKC